MKKRKHKQTEKPTAYIIADIITKALTAIAALITAIKG